MKLFLAKGMYTLRLTWILRKQFGKDVGGIILSFVNEPPKPHQWVANYEPSPWDWLQEPTDCIALPLFAP